MFCSNCEKELIYNWKFCTGCGAKAGSEVDSDSAIEFTKSIAVGFGDLNGDGKVDFEDLKIVLGSNFAKSVTKGAAAGAAICIPIPFVGPMAGAIVGGGIAAISCIGSKSDVPVKGVQKNQEFSNDDIMLKLQQIKGLWEKGVISEDEFQTKKQQLLDKL